MNKEKLYREKAEAQLNEWSAELDKLKAQARGASADAALDLGEKIEEFEAKFQDGVARLKKAFQDSKRDEVAA